MRSSSAVVGNPGDDRSGMVFHAVVHFIEATSKKCRSAAGVCKLLMALSLSLGEQIEVSHRQEHVKTDANYLSLQWLVERCWEFLDAATAT